MAYAAVVWFDGTGPLPPIATYLMLTVYFAHNGTLTFPLRRVRLPGHHHGRPLRTSPQAAQAAPALQLYRAGLWLQLATTQSSDIERPPVVLGLQGAGYRCGPYHPQGEGRHRRARQPSDALRYLP